MSTQENVQTITRDAGADLTAGQYHFVDIDSGGDVVLAGNGLNSIGVLLNKPNTGEAATVAISGVAKVVVGTGGLAAQALVQSDASGEAIAAIASDFVVARHIGTVAVATELAEVLIGSNHLNIA